MYHVLIVGGLGLVLGSAGFVAALAMPLGPMGYPIALLFIPLPALGCAGP